MKTLATIAASILVVAAWLAFCWLVWRIDECWATTGKTEYLGAEKGDGK